MQHPESTYRMRQDLPKKERLCSEKIIARLFQSGVFVSKYPLRLNAVVEAVMLQLIVVQPTVVDLTLVQATAMESPLVDSAEVNETDFLGPLIATGLSGYCGKCTEKTSNRCGLGH